MNYRELIVLELTARGHTLPGIGEKLGLSERTIQRRMAAILNELGARTPAQAVAIGYERHLLGGRRRMLVPVGSASPL